MENLVTDGVQSESDNLSRFIRLCCAVMLFVMTVYPSVSRAQTPLLAKPHGSDPIPEPAIPAILAAFDKYEVVGMGEAHGDKDKDDLILLRQHLQRR